MSKTPATGTSTSTTPFLVDVGTDATAGRVALDRAKKLMNDTGAVTIAEGLVVNASDIQSIALQDATADG
jgi:hypothetical protein